MGCSRQLLSIIAQISKLDMTVRGSSHRAETQAAVLKDEISQRLQGLRQTPPNYANDAHYLTQIAEAKRLAAMLHLEERVPIYSPHSLDELQVIVLINSILLVLSSIPTTSAAVLWPLFIVGSSTMATPRQRMSILERLKQLEVSRKLGSIHHARRLLERKMTASSISWREHGVVALGSELHLPTENEKWISLA